jgi:C1A family cysteine protease
MNLKSVRAGLILLTAFAAGSSARAQEPVKKAADAALSELQSTIKTKGAKWTAGETSISRLSASESGLRLGLVFGPIKAPPLPALTEAAATILPKNLDWREQHAVSGIRDQGQCGSCWAFAMTQALESHVMIERKSSADVSLSEQVLLSCSGVGTCEEGGTLNADFLRTTGLPPAKDFPYKAENGDCKNAAAGWREHAYKIKAWNKVEADLVALKAALSEYGPLPTSFQVMDDFKYYKSGVYSFTQGKSLGGHAVLLVGYDDDGQYFIVKNSWGPDWGEGGFFRIAYSEMSDSVHFGQNTIAYTSGPGGAEELTSAPKESSPAEKLDVVAPSQPDAPDAPDDAPSNAASSFKELDRRAAASGEPASK